MFFDVNAKYRNIHATISVMSHIALINFYLKKKAFDLNAFFMYGTLLA